MKKMNLVKKCSLALFSIMLIAFLAACSNGGSSSSDSGSGGGGGGSGSTGIKEDKAPATELFAESEVSEDWTFVNRGAKAIKLSAGSWECLAVDDWGQKTDAMIASYTIADPNGTVTCSSAKEIKLITLSDDQINDLKGADAQNELNYIKQSKGYSSFNQDKAYMDTKSKILVLEKTLASNSTKTDNGREVPLACAAADHIKANDANDPTKYIVYWNSSGTSLTYWVKK